MKIRHFIKRIRAMALSLVLAVTAFIAAPAPVFAGGVTGEVPGYYTLSYNGHTIYLHFNQGSEEDHLYIMSPTAGDWIINNRPNVHITFYSEKYGYSETDVFYTSRGQAMNGYSNGTGIDMSQSSSNWDHEYRGGSRYAMQSAWLHNAYNGNRFYPSSITIDGLPAAHTHNYCYTVDNCASGYYTYCSCGAIGTVYRNPGHSYGTGNGDITQNKDCTHDEYRANLCTRCYNAVSGSSKTGNRLCHVWDEGVESKAATPYSEGLMHYTCTRDGTHTSDQVIPKRTFNIYSGGDQIKGIYLGSTPINDLLISGQRITKGENAPKPAV